MEVGDAIVVDLLDYRRHVEAAERCNAAAEDEDDERNVAFLKSYGALMRSRAWLLATGGEDDPALDVEEWRRG